MLYKRGYTFSGGMGEGILVIVEADSPREACEILGGRMDRLGKNITFFQSDIERDERWEEIPIPECKKSRLAGHKRFVLKDGANESLELTFDPYDKTLSFHFTEVLLIPKQEVA